MQEYDSEGIGLGEVVMSALFLFAVIGLIVCMVGG